MDEEIINRRRENERLTILVTLLVDKINQLQQQLTLFTTTEGEIREEVYSHDNVLASEKKSQLSQQKQSGGKVESLSSHQKESGGKVESPSSQQKEFGGKVESPSSRQKEFGGKVESPSSQQKEFDEKDLSVSSRQKEFSDNTAGFIPDPLQVKARLRPIMIKGTRQSVRNTVKILIQLYTQPRNTHESLQQLTGLTLSGIAKRIWAMKKAGLIEKAGYQAYSLTEKSIQIIEG